MHIYVLIQGVECTFVNDPPNNTYMSSDLVNGPVAVGIRQTLPFKGNSCHFRRGFDTKVLFSDHFCAFWGGQNKRISVGLFSFYSIARKTVGLNPTHFHINFFLSC